MKGAKFNRQAAQARMLSMSKQKGLSLIEIMIYTVLAALLLAAIIGVISLVRGDSKLDTEGKRLQFGAEKMLSFLATSADTSSANNQLAIRVGAVPADAVQTGNVITTKWGGTTTYAPVQIAVANDALGITQTRADEKTCLNYVKANGGSFTRVQVNGTIVKAPTDNGVIEATLGTACTNAAAGNTLLFERLKS